MAIEIERKFLVVGEYKSLATTSYYIAQGYLSKTPARTIRIRLRGDKAFLTIKAASAPGGLSRYEFETEISIDDGRKLLAMCDDGIIEKYRHLVPCGKHVCEVDEFLGRNAGLVMAEIELSHEAEPYVRPSFLGKEVTGQVRYYNAQLSLHPYDTWQADEKD